MPGHNDSLFAVLLWQLLAATAGRGIMPSCTIKFNKRTKIYYLCVDNMISWRMYYILVDSGIQTFGDVSDCMMDQSRIAKLLEDLSPKERIILMFFAYFGSLQP